MTTSHGIFCWLHGCDELLFLSSDAETEEHVFALLNICSWKSAHRRQLNLDETWVVFIPGKPRFLQDLYITGDETVAQSATIENTTTSEGQTAVSADPAALNCYRFTHHQLSMVINFMQPTTSWNSPVLFQTVSLHIKWEIVWSVEGDTSEPTEDGKLLGNAFFQLGT